MGAGPIRHQCRGRHVVVGMYPTSPAAEIDHLVNASDTEILFIEDQEQFDKIIELRGRLPKLRKLIIFDPKGTGGETEMDLTSFDALLEEGRAALDERLETVSVRKAAIKPDETAMMVFTSGSTGLPKAAEITQANLYTAATFAAKIFAGFSPGTNILSYLPLCHIAEQNMTVINALTGQFVMNFGESLRTVTLDLRDVAPQIFFGVPRIWEKMQSGVMVQANTAGRLRHGLALAALASANKRSARPRSQWTLFERAENAFWDLIVYRHIRAYLGLSRCRFAITAAAPISTDLLRFLRGIGINVREIWGMSETTGAASLQPDWGESDGRVGFFLPEVQWRDCRRRRAAGQGGYCLQGLLQQPEATEAALTDGWLHTGDVAEAAPDGSISIVDRKKDIMINAAGKNLAPSLIENTMKASPYIKECIVIADRRPYATALIQIDPTPCDCGRNRKGSATPHSAHLPKTRVADLVDREVDRQNQLLARVEQIKKVWLLPKELDHDDGEVTATMKVRRAKIYDLYSAEIEALYTSASAA
jgi:long-chain acyl-CoA synthetase